MYKFPAQKGFFSRFMSFLVPEGKLKYPIIALWGIILGFIALNLKLSNALSYLSDDPKACINCHIMVPEYTSWNHGSHGRSTTCNDCHVPHTNVFAKYFFKAKDGLRHATMFTFRLEPDVIKMHEAGQQAVQWNCIRCHSHQVQSTCQRCHANNKQLASSLFENNKYLMHGSGRKCWECHRQVPHGRVHSLASSPNAKAPIPGTPVPNWIINYVNNKKGSSK